MHDQHVIAAIASPVGRCARIVLRLSGKGSWDLAGGLVKEPASTGEGASTGPIDVRGMELPAALLRFRQGHSYTGEESIEIHLPGNPLLAQMALEKLYSLGAKAADPGEFTARAFFNGRMDLTAAEGVASVISATNERELNAARRLQTGELARRLAPIADRLTQTLALLEAGIDFSDEDIRFLSPTQARSDVQSSIQDLEALLANSSRFDRLSHEPAIALCGWPNAGKSSLLNALAGRIRAVVSPAAGTTRDLLSVEAELLRGTVHLIDTAGLALPDRTTQSAIADAMQARSRRAIVDADVVVLLHAADDSRALPSLIREPHLIVQTKSDLGCGQPRGLSVSARTGAGLPHLRDRLDELAFGGSAGDELALNARHVAQLEAALGELRVLQGALGRSDELVAEHLRSTLDLLGEITGFVSADDLLGRIFSSFCIGK